MTLLSLLSLKIPNFHNLAIFICHLFVDGQFGVGHIISDSTNINSNIPELIAAIQSTCPNTIPWLSTDVANDRSPTPWQRDQNTDNILQLIFLDPQHSSTNVNNLKALVTYYHFFVFYSNDGVTVNDRNAQFAKLDSNLLSSALILHFDSESENERVSVYKPSVSSDNEPIYIETIDSFSGKPNLFDETFKTYDHDWLLIINYFIFFPCAEKIKMRKVDEIYGGNAFMANFFSNHLKIFDVSYLNISLLSCWDSSSGLVQRKNQQIYKELTIDNQPKDLETLEKLRAKHSIFITFYKFDAIELGDANVIPLYPYHSTELSLIYIYGAQSTRTKFRITMTGVGFVMFSFCFVFYTLVSVVLYYVRRRLNLRRDEFISCWIDIWITFFAGGNLNAHHKFERWIIGIFLIGSFFLNTFYCNAVLFPSFLTFDSSVKTFDDLAKLNPPIYTSPIFADSETLILENLRQKLGANVIFGEPTFLAKILQREVSHFVYVISKDSLIYMNTLVDGRKFDVLEESLDDLNARFFLTSNEQVPDRITRIVNEKTSAMMESGLYRFYSSMFRFWVNIQQRIEPRDSNSVAPLTLEQLAEVMKLYVLLMGTCCIVFSIEVSIKYWKRNNRISQMEMGTAEGEIEIVVSNEQPMRPPTGPSNIDLAGPSRPTISVISGRATDSAGPSNETKNLNVHVFIRRYESDSDSSD